MSSPTGTCALCGELVDVSDLITHLRVEHDHDADFECWPDGTPVVIDRTLEPSDFPGGSPASTDNHDAQEGTI